MRYIATGRDQFENDEQDIIAELECAEDDTDQTSYGTPDWCRLSPDEQASVIAEFNERFPRE
jgi:hypothetical protein